MQFISFSIKTVLFILFLFSLIFDINAQTNDSTKYKFGADVEVNYRTVFDDPAETDIIISPVFQYYTGAFSIYAGPSIQTNIIKSEHKNKYGFKMGFNYFFPAHKDTRVKGNLKTELYYIRIWEKQILYDHAIPNIDIPVTIREKKIDYGVTFRVGITCRILKRFFIGINIGPALLIEEDYGVFQKGSEVHPLVSNNPAFTEELQLGIKF